MDEVLRLPVPARPDSFGQEPDCAKNAARGNASCFLASADSFVLPLAVQTLMTAPSDATFPLIVFTGPAGSGKTHLSWGLARTRSGGDGHSSVPYFCAGDLCYARRFGKEPASESQPAKLAAWELLAIDDLSRLAGKEREQGELTRILDRAQRSGLTVVCTLDRPPRCAGLVPALESRLTAGLHVPLPLPNLAVRKALLAQFSSDAQLDLPADARDELAKSFSLSAPELRGILLTFAAEQRCRNARLLADAAREFAAAWAIRPELSLRAIATQAARHFALNLSDLKAPSRRRCVVLARAVAIYLARKLTRKTLDQIGAFFGGRDHTTVLHSFRRTQRFMQSDSRLRQSIEQLGRSLEAI